MGMKRSMRKFNAIRSAQRKPHVAATLFVNPGHNGLRGERSRSLKMMIANLKRTCFGILLLMISLPAVAAQQSQSRPTADMEEANRLLQAQKWGEAAKLYEAITQAEPANARAWYQLGWSRHGLGEYERAIGAFQKNLELNKGTQRAAFSMYAIAVMYTSMKDKEKAFEWLDKALSANLPSPRQIKTDPNLAALRDDPRFEAVMEKAERAAQVCMNIPEYRQFDFWVGDWNVVGAAGQQLGTNKVLLLEGGCIVAENWTSASGGTGKSFNFYNPITKKWHQSYMDESGGNWMMEGEYKDGVLRYEGAIYSPGSKVPVRMSFFNLGPDKVRQTAETSADNGKTWTPVWDGLYIRKK
jgi:tetratricopeptide (TPR) repeat protein